MDIINTLLHQTKFIQRLFSKDVKEKNVTDNYFIFDKNNNFLNVDDLRSFITINKVENHIVIKEIYNTCLSIIDLWNNKLCELPNRRLKELFVFHNKKAESFGNTSIEFHAIVVNEGNLKLFNSIEIKQDLCNNATFERLDVALIAKRCANIINWLTASYPELKDNISDNDFIKGKITLRFTPDTDSGYYEVIKENIIREYTLQQYFNLHLQNWESYIDEVESKNDKLKAVANAIFDLQKDKYDNNHPEILKHIKKNIKHLNSIKEYLTSNYSEASHTQPIETGQNQTRNIILEQFNLLDKRGWEYAFRTKSDYNTFVDILTNFFEYKEYDLPETILQLKKGCKTRLAATLGKIHSELSNNDTLIGDKNFFLIVKVLNHFSELSKEQIYQDLTRHGRE